MRVPLAIDEANAGKPYPPADTAIALGLSPGNAEFRMLLSSSLKYGFTVGTYKTDYVQIVPGAQAIVAPKDEDERRAALMAAALTPETFRQMYDFYKGKKLPDDSFMANTVVREFEVPREHAARCVEIFKANVVFVGLTRQASTGTWLSTELLARPSGEDISDDPTDAIDEGEVVEGEPAEEVDSTGDAPPTPPPGPTRNAIFVGHGKNRKPLEQLQKILEQLKIPFKVAIDEANRFRPISEKVADTMRDCGAAILIFTADEEFRDKDGETIWRPSENVVYELGAASAMYGNRIIIFKESDVHFPTNFRDIGYISFEKDQLSAKMHELLTELLSFGLVKVVVGE